MFALRKKLPAADAAQPGAAYAYKASLIGSAHRFELTDAGLSWQAGRKNAVWPYDEIARIALSYRPVSMQSQRFRADIQHADGRRVAILSTSWQTASLMVPQDKAFRAFMVELHRRMAAAGSRAQLVGGLRPGLYAGSVVLLALVATAMTALLARALATGAWGGALFIVGFAALFGWQVGGFVRRNKPRGYTFAELPEQLLP